MENTAGPTNQYNKSNRFGQFRVNLEERDRTQQYGASKSLAGSTDRNVERFIEADDPAKTQERQCRLKVIHKVGNNFNFNFWMEELAAPSIRLAPLSWASSVKVPSLTWSAQFQSVLHEVNCFLTFPSSSENNLKFGK